MKKVYLTAKKVDALLAQKWLYRAVWDFGYSAYAGSDKDRQAEETVSKYICKKRK